MKMHKFNFKESYELYSKTFNIIEKKQCYANIFNIIGACMDKFTSGEYKVAYGFMPTAVNPIHVRHCFIVNSSGEAVDPTAILVNGEDLRDSDLEYYSFITLGWEEYFDILEKNSYFPDLHKTLKGIEEEAVNELRAKGKFCIG